MPDKPLREKVLARARRVVVKVGTGAVCAAGGGPDRRAIGNLAGQIAELRAGGVSVVLVASGAIGTGVGELGLAQRPQDMPRLQAAAAIGQGQLMRTFHDAFARRGVRVAQVLLTRDDLEDRTRYLNFRNTLRALEEFGALPICNENDTVAVDDIRFGENDILAALVASTIAAEALILLTNVDGLLAGGEVLDVVEQVDDRVRALDSGTRSTLGSGGMASKLQAARLVAKAGEVTVVANARTPRILPRLLAGERLGTLFVPERRRLSSRRRWIGQASRPAGRIVVDAGAARALTQGGRSLLPSGIVAVDGSFPKGATVTVFGPEGGEIARGLVNYSAEQVGRIKGLRSGQIAKVLGDRPYDEVIHRNNLMLR